MIEEASPAYACSLLLFVDEKLLEIISLLKTITQAPLIQIPFPKNFQQLVKNMASADSVGNSL
jgi:hypothetical protein